MKSHDKKRTRPQKRFLIGSLGLALIGIPAIFALLFASAAADTTAVSTSTTIFSEGFESGIGGTAADLDGATNGEYYWGTTTFAASEGSNSAWVAGGGAQGSVLAAGTDNYPNNALSALTFGPYDLSSYKQATLTYDYWVLTEASLDVFQVQVSTDGTNFTAVDSKSGDESSWNSESLNLTSYTGEAAVWIRFFFSSNGATTNTGVFIDNIELSADDEQLYYFPIAQLQPTPTPIPYLFFDDFSVVNRYPWPLRDNRNDPSDCWRWFYTTDQRYKAEICDDRTDIKGSPFVRLPEGDYVLEVQARFAQPDAGWWTAYGILFEAKDEPNPALADLGDYNMLWVLWEGKNQTKWKILRDIPGAQEDVIGWQDVPSAYNFGTTNNQFNTWRIERSENYIDVYLNGQFVQSIFEPRPRNNNQVLFGVYASTYETNSFAAEFDNYRVTGNEPMPYQFSFDPTMQTWVSGEFDLEHLLPQAGE